MHGARVHRPAARRRRSASGCGPASPRTPTRCATSSPASSPLEDVPSTRCCPSPPCRRSCGSRRSRCSAPTGSASTCSGSVGRRLDEHVVAAGPLAGRRRRRRVRGLTQMILGYQDHVASQVAETYTRDYEALNRSRAHVRRSLVQDVLRGKDERAVGDRPGDPGLPPGAAPRRGRSSPPWPRVPPTAWPTACARPPARQQSLVYPLSLTSTVVWLRRIEPWHAPALDAVAERPRPLGVVAAVSDPGSGIDGFRIVAAPGPGRRPGAVGLARPGGAPAPRGRRYADAGLEILLMQNDELARTFVESELGDAGRGHPRGRSPARDPRGVVPVRQPRRRRRAPAAARAHRAQPAAPGRGAARARLQERRTELQVAVRLLRLLGGTRPRTATR